MDPPLGGKHVEPGMTRMLVTPPEPGAPASSEADSHVSRRTPTAAFPCNVTAKSGLPSPLKSAIAIANGSLAAAYVAGPKVSPLITTVTSFDPLSAIARSGLPSSFRSPIAMEVGDEPVSYTS